MDPMSDPIEDLKKLGIRLEPDLGPTPHHRRVIATKALSGTRTGHRCLLECGHEVLTFGDLRHSGGIVLCDECRKAAKS
jgi:hypothetical protein